MWWIRHKNMNKKELQELLKDLEFAEIRQDAVKQQLDMLDQHLKYLKDKVEQLLKGKKPKK